ncbi:ATPase, T2SS/T4P/T4SS family, partial [Streptomyces niveiscabiei]|uniref:ATPase, T2SS/T4P/T4SS family n=1 Tax=Streptomyces niveiscabiei TaxID=164115 RepID=UPI0038F64E57
MALSAAETGHLVFGTLHTNSALQTINRLVDVFPPDKQNSVRHLLSFVLIGVISQQLLLRRAGRARVLSM